MCRSLARSRAAARPIPAQLRDSARRTSPDSGVSRLISPRRLEPNTPYYAFVVPTFEVGRKAGLGLAIDDGDRVRHDARLAQRRASFPSITSGTSAPARAATSRSWSSASSRARSIRASASATWTSPRPASACRSCQPPGDPRSSARRRRPRGRAQVADDDAQAARAHRQQQLSRRCGCDRQRPVASAGRRRQRSGRRAAALRRLARAARPGRSSRRRSSGSTSSTSIRARAPPAGSARASCSRTRSAT